MGDVYICCFLIHLYQREQICNDLILSVDLSSNITHKLLIQFYRNVFLCKQGICQNLHGSQGCLQFMGHIGYKLLPGFIKNFHAVDHLVECICDQLCLRIVRNTDFFIQHAICQVFNGLRHSCKWFYKYCGEQPCQKYRKNNNTSDQHHASLFHLCQCFCNINSRNTYQHHALKLLHIRTLYRNCKLQYFTSGVIIACLFSFQTGYSQ